MYGIFPIIKCIDTINFCSLIGLNGGRGKGEADPFASKLPSTGQNNVGQNIGYGLNFVTCEQTLMYSKVQLC